jgi:hypothetical protein
VITDHAVTVFDEDKATTGTGSDSVKAFMVGFNLGQSHQSAILLQDGPVVFVLENEKAFDDIINAIRDEDPKYYNEYWELTGDLKKDPEMEDIKNKIKSLSFVKTHASNVTVFDKSFKGFVGKPPSFKEYDISAKFLGDGPAVTIKGDFDPESLFFGISDESDINLLAGRIDSKTASLIIGNKKYEVLAIDTAWSGASYDGMIKLKAGVWR